MIWYKQNTVEIKSFILSEQAKFTIIELKGGMLIELIRIFFGLKLKLVNKYYFIQEFMWVCLDL